MITSEKKTKLRCLVLLSTTIFIFSFNAVLAAEKQPVLVGFDGAYGLKSSTSAQAIELGIRAAIHEINNDGGVLDGRPLELITRDNRSVPSRGLANLKSFAAMKDLVAVFGGRFSPVFLQQVKSAHELKVPLLDVWAAAEGITDHQFSPSYTFRLSLKDSWAIPVMASHALQLGKAKVGVLLPNTGWGRSNQKVLASVSAQNSDIEVVGTNWYNWGEKNMLSHYEFLLAKKAEAIIFVGIAIEGSLLIRQLEKNPSIPRLPIISHWGVTGGDMVNASGPTLNDLDFSVVQTFSFFNADSAALEKFMNTAKIVSDVEQIYDLKSPVGTAHAYDMMHVLAKAINRAGTTARPAIRDAMESGIFHQGLVRDYKPAFTSERHDALSPQQVFMARYRKDGVIVPLKLNPTQ